MAAITPPSMRRSVPVMNLACSPSRIFLPAPMRRTMAVPILPAPKSAITSFCSFLSNIS